jgi:putative tricarboxylic transport membrane protein
MIIFRQLSAILVGLTLLGSGLMFSAPSQALPISECLAPAKPGGGWDFTCRSVGKLLYQLNLVDNPIHVVNMPGAVGAIAFANVAKTRADDSDLIVATSTVGITQIAQGRYPGDFNTMRWIGMLGTDVGVILVDKDSPYRTLHQLLNAIIKDPASVVMSGSSGVSGWDAIRAFWLLENAGMPADELSKLHWVEYQGGGPAVTQMMGHHVDMVSTDLGEIAGFVKSGDVRVLAVLSKKPLPKPFDKLPTAISQGYDVVGYNWRGFYTGGKVSDADYNSMVKTLKKLYDSPEWKKVAKKHGLIPMWRGGKPFEDFIKKSIDKVRKISQDIGVIK